MKALLVLARWFSAGLVLLSISSAIGADQTWVEYEPGEGPGAGKHIVLLAGDEEYRSEEAMPMLAKILSQRHGFKCTVLFSVDANGLIDPNNQESVSRPEAMETADAIIMFLRYRKWPENALKHFVAAYRRGVPIVALRTSTHAFQYPANHLSVEFNKFGERVLGEEWVSHWGRHKVEATRGVIEPSAKDHPILRGVRDVFGDTDVYEAYPPADATILMRGQVLKGMNPNDPPASYRKKRASDKQEQDVNDPMMPVVWIREHQNEAGTINRVLCTTLGSATDLQSEGLRRLLVNGVYWGLKLEAPAEADVRFVGEFRPTMYGFGGFQKGVRPSDHRVQKPARLGASVAPFRLSPGEHVAILGNALPDRMQHSGHFETLIHAAFPQHKLVVRNLAAAGDEVGTWFRSENFGTRDEWLKKVEADVIFAFYGFNESVKSLDGLASFKAQLDTFLKEATSKDYSGKGAPRVVLFSPIAREKHQDPNFEDTTAINANIELYTAAMADVARQNGVPFVDLLEPTRKLFAQAAAGKESLTVNGHYLTDQGDRLLAPFMFESLFGMPAPSGNWEKLRAAVNEKNVQWHQRYRTVDGYNVYGGRSALAYQANKPGFISDRNAPEPHISNYKVMQEEMAQRDVMTANRDRRVWAIANGGDLVVDDSNLPPVTEAPSNKLGPLPDGRHVFLSGEEAISKMTVHSGMKVNLFADEKQFPELANPVQMAWDTRGRLWVAAWPNYPERRPTSKKGDSLLVFEDTNWDGKADTMTVFADNLNAPTGFQFYKDGVLLMQAPDLWFLRDTNGDGRADWKERILMGMDSADSHHTANAICLDPGGAVYLSDGVFHRTQVETIFGPVRNSDAAIYRFEPRTARFEIYISYGFANPHGRVFDRWGNDLVTDATGNNTYFGPAFSGWLDPEKGKHSSMKQFWERPSRPCPGTGMLSSRHFPEEFQGNFLNCNVISFQGIFRVKVSEDGSGLKGETLENLISSSDPNFRPADVKVGPDGAIYFVDWHNPIIGHMQHHIRDPNRDHEHGRIYRITYEGRPLLKPARIHGQPIPALLDLLKAPEDSTRELAKVELGKHDTQQVVSALKKWIASLDKQDPNYQHHLLEALWVHQWHNAIDLTLLERMLTSPEPRARAAAGRVLCYWRDRVPNSLDLFQRMAEDEHPRVRLEAARGASFYRTTQAADVALAIVKRPMDYYLEYTLNETLRQLEPFWKKAITDGAPIAADNPAGLDRLLGRLTAAELEKLPPNPPILVALLKRPDVADPSRLIALDTLAKQRKSSRTTELLSLFDAAEKQSGAGAERMARLLPMLAGDDLRPARERVERLARNGISAEVRQPAWAALLLADETFDRVWQQASQNPDQFAEMLGAIPLVLDASLRSQAYERVTALVKGDSHAQPMGAVRRAAIRALASIPRDAEKTFALLANLASRGEEVVAVAQAIRLLPRDAWSKDGAALAAPGLVAWAKKVPASDRTGQDYVETVQVASDLAGILPLADADRLRRDLRELRVAVFVVRAVREQMRFDVPRIVVEAGKPFELIFENTDFMPHNLVVMKPGAREKLGPRVERMKPDTLDSKGRAYVPNSSDILDATKLLEPGQRATLKLRAPDSEGNHEYVCTFPGHWQVMWGQLVVTKDVEAYLAKNPVAAKPEAAGHKHGHFE